MPKRSESERNVSAAEQFTAALRPYWRWTGRALALTGIGLLAGGCHLDMWNQPKQRPLSKSEFFEDGAAARPLEDGVVPFGYADRDQVIETGVTADGQPAMEFPMELSAEVLERGRERFNIYCAMCHDQTGTGQGIIVQRGFTEPPSFHEPRLREATPGHFFDVITNGVGDMYPQRSRVVPEDRWAIAAYIRVLQLSQHATIDDVPEDAREELE